ncbi:Fc.00g056180.m01.CDS01 [Cosmosporella sp. VM-42]
MTITSSEPDHISELDVQKWAELYSNHLSSSWPYQRTPKKTFDAFVEKTIKSPKDNTAWVFFHKGFSVWLAYALNSTTSSNAEFDELSIDVRKRVAHCVSEVALHDSVKRAVLDMEPQRLRLNDSDVRETGSTSPNSNTINFARAQLPDETSVVPNKRRRLNGSDVGGTGSTNPNSDSTDFARAQLSDETSVVHCPNGETSSNALTVPAVPQRVFKLLITEVPGVKLQRVENPPIQRIRDLFSDYMAEAIPTGYEGGKITGNVNMVFPTQYRVVDFCELSVIVRQNTVEYFAAELFGVHIELTATGREIICDSGARFEPCPVITLKRALTKNIAKEYGPRVFEAFDRNRGRQEEAIGNRRYTRFLQMNVAREISETSEITIQLDMTKGLQIKALLFGE